ncbi:hypothetical protein BCD_1492 (plasmid) [Borrelia crocidurae DOU]|uniref:Uncharacterized protein n=2 Tax=Borrelia crocidurae DOU TaxID=1293575 RepID=W5SLJ7_9SPIR|nr:hypothetical protein [Borrelia crocidurae]AHH07558.1 hypothetical protein BCD_1492 [Borrelia crocidurae DOU]
MQSLNALSELLLNIDGGKLIIISLFILGMGSLLVFLFKPITKDIINILVTKFKCKDKDKSEDL